MGRLELKLVGSGGQGIATLGRLVASAAHMAGKQATATIAYGGEARGGSSWTDVIVDEEAVDSPRATSADILVLFSQEGAVRFATAVKEHGLVLYDPATVTEFSCTRNARVVAVPATRVAREELNDVLAANTVMFGALASLTGILPAEVCEAAIAAYVPGPALTTNIRAFRRGLELGSATQGRKDSHKVEFQGSKAFRTELMMGNIALAEGAIAAGCRVFAGYPITPANEISEHLSRRLPEVGGFFFQAEDEMSAIGVVIGSVWAGTKAMTATSGPGFSLMQEHIGHAANIEVPLVIANIQRVGPGGGAASEMSADVMQAKWGAHGDYEVIALAPSSCQEMFDLTIEAFNYAGTYRVPVIILGDALLGHMWEPVRIPTAEELKAGVMEWAQPTGDPQSYIPFTYEEGDRLVIPPTPRMATPYHPRWAMSVPHSEKGGQVRDMEVAFTLVKRINDKIRRNKDRIVRWEARFMDDAELAVISYGIVSRPCLRAVKEARREGIKVGYLRLITLWPFPDTAVRDVLDQVRAVLVPEMNYGQVSRLVEGICGFGKGRVLSLGRARLHEAAEIFGAIKEMAG